MSAAFVQSWPGSRVLLGWWRELAVRKPQQISLGRLLIHRIEVLVQVRKPRALDSWQRALLGLADARVPHGGELLSSLSDLQMDPQVLGQFVRELTESGLLHQNGSGLCQMTSTGRHALQTGAVSVAVEERRTFAFVDNSALGQPPHFLPLSGGRQPPEFRLSRGADASRSEESPFELAELEACLRRTPEWKARFRFPMDVESLLPPRPDESPTANWRRVILDAVERQLFVFIHTAQTSAAPLMLGFCVRPDGWVLEPEPLLALSEGWEEALPDLAAEPSPQLWQQAWQTWSHPRRLPLAEVAACRLQRVDHRLLVHAPLRMIDRLRAERSDAVKQEAWLLAGEGRTRRAAQIELHAL
jgi:hypothetical protein